MSIKFAKILPFLIGVLIFAAAGYGLFYRPHALYEEEHAGHESHGQLWMCPMMCVEPQPEPGRCPVCSMDLVPMPEDMAGSREEPTIVLSTAAQAVAEVETVPVVREFADIEIRLGGKVGFDETRERVISAWVQGRLERVFVDNTGTVVNKGEPLVEIYSRQLNSEKAIYLSTLKDKPLAGESPERRRELNRARLMLLGLTAEQLDELEKRTESQYTEMILSPISGTVVQKNVREGMYVSEGETLYKVADLSRVWVWLEAYESDLPFIRYGQDVDITTPAFGNERFAGTVSFIEPVLNDMTRTARVRVQVDNPDFKLKPNMIVRAFIRATVGEDGGVVPSKKLQDKWICPRHPEIISDKPGRCEQSLLPLLSTEALGYVTQGRPRAPLLVPRSAVLFTGRRGFVYTEERREGKTFYTGQEVELGPLAGGRYVIKSGLEEGQRVVANGAFRIDSALQLSGRPSMMRRPGSDAPAGGHAGHGAAAGGSAGEAPAMVKVPKLELADEKFKAELVKLFKAYYVLQRALGDDNKDASAVAARALADVPATLDAASLSPKLAEDWREDAARIVDLCGKLAAEDDIEKMRTVFVPLSASFEDLARAYAPLPGLEIYRAFCPMAFGDNGAYWLQEGKVIHNPYEGSRMLKCGLIKEELSGGK